MQRNTVPCLRQVTSLLRGENLRVSEGFCRALSTPAEETSYGDAGAVSGVPDEVFKRKVTIYAPARTASQQGLARTLEKPGNRPMWKLEFRTQEKWQNPLIGWTSTADPLENVFRATTSFSTAEDAVAFCKEYGWEYEIQEPHMRRSTRAKRFMGYGDNFSTKRSGLPDGGLISEGTAEPIRRSAKPSGKQG